MTALEVVRTGPLLTVQDLGRSGHAHLGVPRSGAADLPSHERANAAVGNPAEAATLEATLGGCVLRATGEAVVAVTGARCRVFVGGVAAPWGRPFRVAAGRQVEVGAPSAGVRSYVAVRGGICVPAVLGSRSTDTLGGVGPAPLRVGDVLPVGASSPAGDELFAAAPATPAAGDDHGAALELPLRRGPREDWLDEHGWRALERTRWTVSVRSDRIGVRLEGPGLPRARSGEIPSEGMVRGAVQLPPSGLPVILLADHPTTGGYPVVGVVAAAGVWALAQARPGVEIRFTTR